MEPPSTRAGTRRARRSRRRRGIVLSLCALALGAVLAGTLVTVDEITGGTSGPLASTAPLLGLPTTEPTTVAPPAGPAGSPVDLVAAVASAESAAARDDVVVGVAVADRATGELAPGTEGDETFNAASLAKLVLVVDMMARQEQGDLTLGDRDRRLIRAALGPSSDPAMNALWTEYDGPNAITRVAQRLDLADTTTPDDTSQWGEVQTSPRDMVTVMRHVLVDLPAPDRDLLLGAMGAAPPTAADGFDQGYGLLDGSGSPVKQGWLCCLAARADLHTVGVVDGRFVVAVMTNEPNGFTGARETVDDAVRAVRTGLGTAPAG